MNRKAGGAENTCAGGDVLLLDVGCTAVLLLYCTVAGKNAADLGSTQTWIHPKDGAAVGGPPRRRMRSSSSRHTHQRCSDTNSAMPNVTRRKMASSAALVLLMLVRCSGFTMTASPKSPPSSRAGFLKSILVGVSAASVVAARPVVKSAEAATEPLVETCEMRGRGGGDRDGVSACAYKSDGSC